MGSLFGSNDPDPPRPLPPPPPAPVVEDAEETETRRQRDRLRRAAGRRSTVATSPLGLSDQAPVGAKILTGG